MFETPAATCLRRGFYLGSILRLGAGFGFRFRAIFPAKPVLAGNIVVAGGVFPRQTGFGGFSRGCRS